MKDHYHYHYSGPPPFFDGTNFSHWKVRMSNYLAALGWRVWKAIECGWSQPLLYGQGKTSPKPRNQWNAYEWEYWRPNGIGLNAIFKAMNEKDFRRIRFCKTSKEAWDTLVKAYEWYKDDKETYLQLLDRKFETMKMEDDERFDDFYLRLQELVNTSKELGKKYSDLEIKRKFLRSLPPRFWSLTDTINLEVLDMSKMSLDTLVGKLRIWSKTDTINLEVLDISKMSVDTLVGKLRTCEVQWEFESLQKNKDLAFENLSHDSKNSNGKALESCGEESDIDQSIDVMVKDFKKLPYGRCFARCFSILFRLQKEPY